MNFLCCNCLRSKWKQAFCESHYDSKLNTPFPISCWLSS